MGEGSRRACRVGGLLMVLMILGDSSTRAAVPEPPREAVPASAMQAAIDRLGVVGSVLYVAAHPDDENTRLLAWLHGDRHLSTAYVSLTRGEGGQNLIGSELGPRLGLLRTFELIAARRIDGAGQFFTSAADFGYSKSAAETLGTWDEEAVLGELVEVVRRHAPDLIITRFSTAPPNHGHHTASAILAARAFELAADPGAYPEQLRVIAPHRAARLLENKSPWRFAEGEDLSAYLTEDVGTFDPLRGLSWGEVAARSRSQHKSQGFGSAPAFGRLPEYFALLKGQGPARGAGIFDGLDLGWSRFPGTARVQRAHTALSRAFDPRHPERAIPALIALIQAVEALPPRGPVGHYRALKLTEAEALLLAFAGIVAEARAPQGTLSPGESIAAEAVLLSRTGAEVLVDALSPPHGARVEIGRKLAPREPAKVPFEARLPADHAFDDLPPAIAADRRQRLEAIAHLRVGGRAIDVALPLTHVTVHPVDGERRALLELVPAVTVTPALDAADAMPAPNGAAVNLRFEVQAHGAARRGQVRLEAPPGVTVSPAGVDFALAAGASREVVFHVAPAKGTARAQLVLRARLRLDSPGGEEGPALRRDLLRYPHVPPLSLLAEATARVSVFPLDRGEVRRVAYIRGADDGVMPALLAAGYEVVEVPMVSLPDGAADPLRAFDAIVVGIRSLNVDPDLAHHHARLMDLVASGKTLIWQYIVSNRWRPLPPQPLGPVPLQIRHGRVTDHAAAMTRLQPDHLALSRPNRLEPSDDAGWVQERGLYFAEDWEAPWEPLLRLADPDEAPQDGALMVARHGKGHIVYTGLSFFRQLPAGVPGAFRYFANLLALR